MPILEPNSATPLSCSGLVASAELAGTFIVISKAKVDISFDVDGEASGGG